MTLYIEPERPQRDKRGRFLKGHRPPAKRTVTPRFRAAVLKNLEKAKRVKGRKGLNRCKAIVGIRADKTFVVYPSVRQASRTLGITRTSLDSRCRGEVKNRWRGGYKWYYESDERWMTEIQ